MVEPEDIQKTQPWGIFENFQSGLAQVHTELRQGAASILAELETQANDPLTTDKLILSFSQILLNHHKAEDKFFFPAFRAAGRLSSSDVAFLDACDAEHCDIHRLCLELRELAARHLDGAVNTPDWRTAAQMLVADLKAISLPHFQNEEATLTSDHVARIITGEELVRVYRDMGENWNRR